jgi:C1A family cysteine protease
MAKTKRTTKSRRQDDASTRLKDIKAIPAAFREQLQALGIVRANQLVALARRPETRAQLAEHLGTTEERVTAAETAAETEATSDVTSMAAAGQPLALGALRPPPGLRAAALSIPLSAAVGAAARLPSSANLISKMPPIRNQGNRGTCVAFCLTAIHEFSEQSKPDYSERHLYYEAKLVDGSPAVCGTTQAAAGGELASKGQCLESTWHYNPADQCNNHGAVPGGAAAEAAKHTRSLVALNPQDVRAIKTAVASGRPAGISIPVFNSWYQSPATRSSGRITLPIGNEPEAGGHCMCVVGYQDDGPSTVTPTPGGGFFILRNSWDTTWGALCAFGAGYGTIPYAYISGYNWESFTLPAGTRPKRPRRPKRKPTRRKKAVKKR